MGQQTSKLIDYNPNDYMNDTDLCLTPWSYPNGGLYTDKPDITMKELLNKPLSEQIKYSDAISRRYAKNLLFIETQNIDYTINKIKMLSKKELNEVINKTSIGNVAVLYYYNPDNDLIKEYYNTLIEKLN